MIALPPEDDIVVIGIEGWVDIVDDYPDAVIDNTWSSAWEDPEEE
jgi:hypothetical protein